VPSHGVKLYRLGDNLPSGVPAIGQAPSPVSDKYYNLQGLPVAHPSKGIYIHNGRKIAQ
jgi:hypothetical protein